eukprot:CAMPEP_0181316904 /NCGR_PEP_ID=MMETSP1101-20121128/16143_1 /TAXON_ID=46948 /ORGANISM="Rhodomonas abbreviata, Strain Caron Lab Isolate" /LENGTH=469 /DNA_ID=CAMNT_0023424181 /DNA_START=33 /DNA_END=1442 /DNA_ORIENTATION=+
MQDFVLSVPKARPRSDSRKAVLIAAGTVLCLVVAVVVSQGAVPTLLVSKTNPFGKDQELATINKALAIEADKSEAKSGALHPAGTNAAKLASVHASKSAARAHEPEPKQSQQAIARPQELHTIAWPQEMQSLKDKYAHEMEEARIRTQEELKAEEKNALLAIQRIKSQGKAYVNQLSSKEKEAESVVQAKHQEYELQAQLQNVKKAAAEKAKEIEAKLNAVRVTASKYSSIVSNPLDTNGADATKLHSSSSASAVIRAAAPSNGNTHVEEEIKQLQQQVASLDAKRRAVREKVDHIEQRETEHRVVAAKSASIPAERPVEAAAVHKEPAESNVQEKAHAEQVQPLAPKSSSLKSKILKPLCTENNCDISAEDKSVVTDGPNIHKMMEMAEDGDGSRKKKAMEAVKSLQEEIKADFKNVQDFAFHQEHVLDQVRRGTAAELGHEVMLAVEKSLIAKENELQNKKAAGSTL